MYEPEELASLDRIALGERDKSRHCATDIVALVRLGFLQEPTKRDLLDGLQRSLLMAGSLGAGDNSRSAGFG